MRFSCPGLTLQVEIVNWIRDRSGSPYDSWITCQVQVLVPGFTGTYTCDLLENDFDRFYCELEEMNKKVGEERKARLSGMEPGIDLELVSTKPEPIITLMSVSTPWSSEGLRLLPKCVMCGQRVMYGPG